MNNESTKQHAAKAANFVTGLLTGWGVPAAWAKAVSGAIIGAAIGALVAVGVLTSCTTTYSQSAAGDISYTGSIVIPVEPEK